MHCHRFYKLCLSRPMGELELLRLPCLVFIKKFERFFPWWLENGALIALRTAHEAMREDDELYSNVLAEICWHGLIQVAHQVSKTSRR